MLKLIPLKVKGIIDKDSGKTGKHLPGFNIPIYSCDILNTLNDKDTVIISSVGFEDEIAKELQPYADKGVKILKLYPHCKYLNN